MALSFASPALGAACAPRDMVRVVTVDDTPGVDPNAFSRKPRTVYRLGALFARIEERPLPGKRVQRLTVIREPDVWAVNVIDKTGEHVQDPGPVFEVRAPLFQHASLPTVFQQLEIGCELDFVAAYANKPVGRLMIGKTLVFKYQMSVGRHRIEILLRPPAAKGALPKIYSIGLYEDDQPKSVVRYLTHETGLPADMSLFEMPKGVRFTAKAAAPPTP